MGATMGERKQPAGRLPTDRRTNERRPARSPLAPAGRPGVGAVPGRRPGNLARLALELIAARACQSGIRLAQVAHALGRSESRLSHVLRVETGRSFWEHVHHVRLARAKGELLVATHTIKEVAASVGYTTEELDRHFAMMVTLAFTLTPSATATGSSHSPTTDRFCSVTSYCDTFFSWADCGSPSTCSEALQMCSEFCGGSPELYFCSEDFGGHTFGQCGCTFSCIEG